MSDATVDSWNLGSRANALTALRIFATPFVLIVIAQMDEPSWAVCALWFAVCITDLFDGMIARRVGPTKAGAYLDPLADKILVLGALIVFVSLGIFSWIPVALIAIREVAMSWYRSRVASYGISVPAQLLGKIKAWVQMFAIGFYLCPLTQEHFAWLPNAALWVSVVLAYVSGAQYARDALRLSRSRSLARQVG